MKKSLLTFIIGLCILLFSCKKEIIQPQGGNNSSKIAGQRADGVGQGEGGYSEALSSCTNLISSNFNGTPIKKGNYIWFLAQLKLNTAPRKGTFVLNSTNSKITFLANGMPYNLAVPDAQITFSNTAVSASTQWDPINNQWNTIIPYSQINSDEIFLTGFALPVPSGGFPGGINPVNWTASFTSDAPGGLNLQWQWSAAVYTNFPTNYNSAGIVVIHSSDHAGAPKNFEKYVTGGARGGGGGNYTGSWSSTGSVSTCEAASGAKLPD